MYNHRKRKIEENFKTKLINKYENKESISIETSSGYKINLSHNFPIKKRNRYRYDYKKNSDDEYYIVSDGSDNIEYEIDEKEINLLKKESKNFINNWNCKENKIKQNKVIEKPKKNSNNEKTKIDD
ncbi:5103_t:CDS:2, partial [Dentiscutata heterogama]